MPVTAIPRVLFTAVAILAAVAGAEVPPEPPATEGGALGGGDNTGGELGANAALGYLRAYAWIVENEVDVDGPLTADPDAQEREHLRLLLSASRHDEADFGLRQQLRDRGYLLIMPHIGHARDLQRHALATARARFADGSRQRALELWTASHRHGRHWMQQPTLIARLVGIGLVRTSQDLVFTWWPELNGAERRHLAGALRAAPADPGWDLALLGERLGLRWVAELLADAPEAAARRREVGLEATFGGADEAFDRQRWEEAIERGAVAEWVEDIDRHLQALSDVMRLPQQAAAERIEELEARAAEQRAANPLAAMLLPSVGRLHVLEVETRLREALLRALLALPGEDPSALGPTLREVGEVACEPAPGGGAKVVVRHPQLEEALVVTLGRAGDAPGGGADGSDASGDRGADDF